MSSVTELYQQVILDHNRKPRNFGALEHATHSAEGFNPVCGDHYTIYVNADEAGVIENVAFDGSGCAISKASASMMTQFLKGKTVEEAYAIFDQFHRMATGELKPDQDEHSLGKLAIFAGIWQYPARVKCAILCWHALKSALDGENRATTE